MKSSKWKLMTNIIKFQLQYKTCPTFSMKFIIFVCYILLFFCHICTLALIILLLLLLRQVCVCMCRQDEENLKIVALSNLIDVVSVFLVLHKILLVAKIVTDNNFSRFNC